MMRSSAMMDCSDLKNFKPGAVHYPPNQDAPLKFNPWTGHSFDGVERIQRASDYRGVTWWYNPWTGVRRSLDDVDNDPNGSRIQPPSEYMFPTDGAHFVTGLNATATDHTPPPPRRSLTAHFVTGLNATATELSAEVERCPYCGRRGTDNCDVPPPDVCEKAIAPGPTSPLGEQIGGNHYKGMKIQPVEYIHANGIGFVEGCVIKYVSRWREKNGAEDLKKARHFIDLLLQLENAK